jgi:hypothetical protein
MDVLIEGILHLGEFDIVAASGYQTAIVYQTTKPIVVNDGVTALQFNAVKKSAIISGIEVLLAPLEEKLLTNSPYPKRITNIPTQTPSTKSINLSSRQRTLGPTNNPYRVTTPPPYVQTNVSVLYSSTKYPDQSIDGITRNKITNKSTNNFYHEPISDECNTGANPSTNCNSTNCVLPYERHKYIGFT